jgi:hypothetical protein
MDIVESLEKATGLPRAASPALGGLIIRLIALIYPKDLYMGFENVDIQHTLKLTDIFCFFFKIYLLI